MRCGCFQHRRLFLLLMLSTAMTVLSEQTVFSQVLPENRPFENAEEASTATSSPNDTQQTSAPRATDRDEKKEQLRKSAIAGLLVLSLICIVFLLLIILVALWARRIRMMTRQPLPAQNPDDPLWYLRKGKPRDSSGAAEFTDDRSSPDEP